MGQLDKGKWVEKSIVSSDKAGKYKRLERSFRDTISVDHNTFKPEANRYHLYVSYACPWAHRTLIFRELKDLQDIISVDVVHPDMLENGWSFNKGFKGCSGDSLYSSSYLYEIYQKAQSDVTTSVTVPILWDKKEQTIVNNESSEIIRILNTAFNELTNNTLDFYPQAYRDEIDDWNEKIYEPINNGVYKAGFAKTQVAYEEAATALFDQLDNIDSHLGKHAYLVGEQLTEADIRLVVTLLRFDCVYYTHFKTNKKRIQDIQHLSPYLKKLYALPAIKNTTYFDHIKRHYYYSHRMINPYRIIPLGPDQVI